MIASDPQAFVDWNAKASAFVASLRKESKASGWVRSDLPAICEPFGTEPYFNEIEFNRPLKSIPPAYRPLVAEWQAYLNKTAGLSIRITMANAKTGEPLTKSIPYVHRWTPIYRKSLLAKLYALDAYLGPDVRDVEMISLTTYQRGRDPMACLLQLKAYLGRLIEIMRKRFGTVDYFVILEPHKTGYPHAHLAYFRKLTDYEKNQLRLAWSCVIKAGDLPHGLFFSEPQASHDGTYESGSIGGIRNYFMKYVSKGLYAAEMSPAEQLFNAMLWDSHTRLWSCSRHFSKVMARPVTEANPDWEFLEAYVCDPDGNALSKVSKKFKPTDDDMVNWDQLIEAAR
ncbi:MAG TPA: hypothetical protein VHP31_12435, partial [Caproicibacter sp.]|nr:hypothetical protein [Caproicibacter sp.]